MLNTKSKQFWISAVLVVALIAAVTWCLLNPGYLNCTEIQRSLPRVAHAGGGYNGMAGTDSIDALDRNLDRYELFEIDFNMTRDGQIVCIHDWEEAVVRSFEVQMNQAPSIAEFNKLNQANHKYKHCTLSSLIKWLEHNPRKRIVTDVKDDNLYVLTEIARKHPEHIQRFIPQIYYPNEYNEVRSLGFNDVIFTIYRYGKSDSKVLRNAGSMDLYALTIPAGRAKTLAPRAACLGIPTYAHTVNDDKEFHELKGYGVVEIYTDWLPAP